MLHVLRAFASFEASVLRERVTAGVRRAQARGTHCGRRKVEMDLSPALALLEKGHGSKKVSSMLGVNRATLRS